MADKELEEFKKVHALCRDNFILPKLEALFGESDEYDRKTVQATLSALAESAAILSLVSGIPKKTVVEAFSQTLDLVYKEEAGNDNCEELLH